jgi:uncharacterized RDD family membrane protein YckC
MSSWFYVNKGERVGPVDRAELDARIAEGVVDGVTLVWRVGMSAWVPACRVDELGVPPPVPVAPPPLPLPSTGATVAGVEDSERRAPARGTELVFASFGVRTAAKLIDLTILYGIGALVQEGVAAAFFEGVVPLMFEDWNGWVRFASIAAPINLVIALTYAVYFIRQHEATPGKRMLGLRVVRADGGRIGAGRVIGRHFAEQVSGIVFLAGYVMAAFDDEKRSLHDYMCDTRVVKGLREPEAGPAAERVVDGR